MNLCLVILDSSLVLTSVARKSCREINVSGLVDSAGYRTGELCRTDATAAGKAVHLITRKRLFCFLYKSGFASTIRLHKSLWTTCEINQLSDFSNPF